MNRNNCLLTLILSMLVSCHPFYCSWNSGYEQLVKIEQDDIIHGNYELNESSVEYLNSIGYLEKSTIKLSKSGTFQLTNAPDCLFDSFGRNSGKAISRIGNWSTGCGESYDCMIELQGIFVVPLTRKENGPIVIAVSLGDPDECRGIVYERIE